MAAQHIVEAMKAKAQAEMAEAVKAQANDLAEVNRKLDIIMQKLGIGDGPAENQPVGKTSKK